MYQRSECERCVLRRSDRPAYAPVVGVARMHLLPLYRPPNVGRIFVDGATGQRFTLPSRVAFFLFSAPLYVPSTKSSSESTYCIETHARRTHARTHTYGRAPARSTAVKAIFLRLASALSCLSFVFRLA